MSRDPIGKPLIRSDDIASREWWQKVHKINNPESPAPQSAGLSEREKWERCATVLEVGFGGLYSAHDALLDHFEKQQEGDTELRDRILALADEKGEAGCRAPSPETGQPNKSTADGGGAPPPSSPAGLSAEEVARLVAKARADSPYANAGSDVWWGWRTLAHDLATALEATAARLADYEEFKSAARLVADEQGEIIETLRATLAERERSVTLLRAGMETLLVRSENAEAERDALKKKLAAAERVVEAARARLEVWTRETYVGVRDALAAYDATTPAARKPE